uniref:T-cell surface glycoprotein CD3 delta chain n=1 Tax=Equus asinus TaxID=9793 RepID=A0A9L0J006_EQUAS
MEHCRFLGSLILAALLSQVSLFKIDMDEIEERLILKCNSSIMQLEGTMGTPYKGGLDLGKRILDPRGTYMCGGAKENSSLQVYYRMCQNCVELDSATLAGIVITDIIATLLLALGVYCFAGHETGRLPRAADAQALLRNDQLYQVSQEGKETRMGGGVRGDGEADTRCYVYV